MTVKDIFHKCNVKYIKIRGDIKTYAAPDNYSTTNRGQLISDITSSEDVANELWELEKNPNIELIVLDIDSNGGDSAAGTEIRNAIKYSNKKIISYIRDQGLSAAYGIAAATDYIMANPNGMVGSIGVTSSYTEHSLQNTKEGITFNQLSVGKYKDMHNEDKPLTWEERNIIMEGIKETYESFILEISLDRLIPLENVRKLADGAIMTPSKALENKLIDAIGTGWTFRMHIYDLIDSPKFCEEWIPDWK